MSLQQRQDAAIAGDIASERIEVQIERFGTWGEPLTPPAPINPPPPAWTLEEWDVAAEYERQGFKHLTPDS